MKISRQAFAALMLLPFLTTHLCAEGKTKFYAAQPSKRVADWQVRMDEVLAELETRRDLASTKLVFLGDSITHYWLMAENPWIKGQRGGRTVWDGTFATPGTNNYAINLGVTGDRTEHLLFRLLPKIAGGRGELDKSELKPEFILVMIGINNTWSAEEPLTDSVFAGVKAVLTAVRDLKPQAKILVQSLLPTNDRDRNRSVVEVVNARLAHLANGTEIKPLYFLNLYSSYLNAEGIQHAELFCDGLHLSEAGYRVWRDRLLSFLADIRAAKGNRSTP